MPPKRKRESALVDNPAFSSSIERSTRCDGRLSKRVTGAYLSTYTLTKDTQPSPLTTVDLSHLQSGFPADGDDIDSQSEIRSTISTDIIVEYRRSACAGVVVDNKVVIPSSIKKLVEHLFETPLGPISILGTPTADNAQDLILGSLEDFFHGVFLKAPG